MVLFFIQHYRQMPLHTPLLFIPAQVPALLRVPLFIRLPAPVIQNHARSVHQAYPATPFMPPQAVTVQQAQALSIKHHPPQDPDT
jgi:hypothetical protein